MIRRILKLRQQDQTCPDCQRRSPCQGDLARDPGVDVPATLWEDVQASVWSAKLADKGATDAG